MYLPTNHKTVAVREILDQVVIDVIGHFFHLRLDAKTVWCGGAGVPENLQAEVKHLLALNNFIGLHDQLWIPYQSAMVFRFPTVLCCHNYDPITWAFLMVCVAAKIHSEDVFTGWLTEASFRRLRKAVKKLSRGSLQIMDATDLEDFQLFLEDVAQNGGPCVVHCDWKLEEDEQKSVEMIVKHQDMLFVWPGK